MTKNIILFSILAFYLLSCQSTSTDDQKVKLIPVIDGEFRRIGPEPDLTQLGLQPEQTNVQPNQPNDHHIFKADDNRWHLWACVRGTKAGRILCHWQADSLMQSPWVFTGEIIRADKSYGESLVEWKGQEFIQSPYIVRDDGRYFMFYGGYDCGLNPWGEPLDPAENYNHAEKQICLMTSDDGLNWERHRNENGFSRLFYGPGAARDECVVKFGDTWYIYYCGHHNWDRRCGAIYVRTSDDLIHWSGWYIAHYDKDSENRKWLPESPVVIYKKGYYYLFRTHGLKSGCWVYRSDTPFNFGQGDVSEYFVTHLPGVIAPEIIADDAGNEYITTITDGEKYGILIARLRWEPER